MNFALIPAAGKSERMGRPKLSLSLGGSTVLEHVVKTVRRAGIELILVVVGPHVPDLVPLTQTAGAHVLALAEETPDMRATVERGLIWLEEHFHPQPDDRWLLIPADHPSLDETVLSRLLAARNRRPTYSIIIPTYAGKRGHPTLIDWKHAAGIRAFTTEMGLNVYLRQHPDETLEMPVDTAAVIRDLDTPEDYARLLQSWKPTQ